MYRVSLLHRTAAVLLAAWVTAFQAEPAALHVCAAHDGSAHVSGATHASVASLDADPTDGHAEHGDVAAPTGADQSAPDHEACTCPGGCTVAGTVDVPGTRASLVQETAVSAHDPFSTFAAIAAADPDHLLPFANGPPSLV